MSVTAVHPDYAAWEAQYQILGDVYRGEPAIKDAGKGYLPERAELACDEPVVAAERYRKYKMRARAPDYLSRAVETLAGMMHREGPSIELPARLQYLLEDATGEGESLHDVLREINAGQLLYGRSVPVLDIGKDGPVVRIYSAPALRNWGDGWAILSESHPTLDGYEWAERTLYRVLKVEDGRYIVELLDSAGKAEAEPQEPQYLGRPFGRLPLVAINCSDLSLSIDRPPLLGLAHDVLSIYWADADYREALAVQGNATLVVSGLLAEPGAEGRPVRVGLSSMIQVEIGGDAKYAQPGDMGLAEQRQALDALHQSAQAKAGELLQLDQGTESGRALVTRLSARTANLRQIALSGAAGLERLLRMAAEWVGADPAEVKVAPNLDFAEPGTEPRQLVDLQMARNSGAPLSQRSVHDWMRRQGFTELSYDDELVLIEGEGPG